MIESPDNTENILLGVTGGIAAYKSAEIIRLFQRHHATVKVVMTPSAEQFIGAVTLQALSGFPVYREMFQSDTRAMEHIDLARWANKILIAPATADFIAKLATGRADSLLSTICLAAECPIYIAPAMNQAMWSNPATQNNVATLRNRDYKFLGPESGSQACGETGEGRLMEPETLVEQVLASDGLLKNKKVVITAGPTREAIDPVRYISNHSSGKMGFALAEAAFREGAQVTLITGPVSLQTPSGISVVQVESGHQMYEMVLQNVSDADIFISAAAVADYRAASPAKQKLKKSENAMNLMLEKNPDIVSEVTSKHPQIFSVGFAAETESVEANATAKLKNKGLDMIIANLVGKDEQGNPLGFNADTNLVTLFTANSKISLPEMRKTILAKQIIQQISEHYEKKHSS